MHELNGFELQNFLLERAGKTWDTVPVPEVSEILAFMEEGKEYGIWDFCELPDLKESRTKVILQGLSDYIELVGSNRDRRYKKKRIIQ